MLEWKQAEAPRTPLVGHGQSVSLDLTPLDAALQPLNCGQECFNRFSSRLKAFLAELFPTFFRYKAHQHTQAACPRVFSRFVWVILIYTILYYIVVPTWFQPSSAACPRCMICLYLFTLSLSLCHISAHCCHISAQCDAWPSHCAL